VKRASRSYTAAFTQNSPNLNR